MPQALSIDQIANELVLDLRLNEATRDIIQGVRTTDAGNIILEVTDISIAKKYAGTQYKTCKVLYEQVHRRSQQEQ